MVLCCNTHGIIVLLLYIDGMIVTGDNQNFLNWFHEFEMKELGFIHYFLGIEVTKLPNGLHLSQNKGATYLLTQANMQGCKLVTMPLAS